MAALLLWEGGALHGAVRSTRACSLTARLWFHKAAGDRSSLTRQPGGALALGMPLGIVIFVRPHRPGGEEDEDQKERPAHHSASTCVRVDEGGAAGRTRGGAPWFQAGVVPLAASEQGPCSGEPLGSHPSARHDHDGSEGATGAWVQVTPFSPGMAKTLVLDSGEKSGRRDCMT